MKKIIFFFGLLILNNTYADIPTKEFAECSSKKGDLDKIEVLKPSVYKGFRAYPHSHSIVDGGLLEIS